jgi:hypothetical protein
VNQKGDIMRILSIALFSILLAASTVIAGFTLKSGVYRMNELDAAKSAALSGRKAVAFLYSDENTFCTQCMSSSLQAMETLAGSCIVVYVDKSDAAKLPNQAKNALRSPEAGKYIPTIIIMSYDLKKVIAIVPYARGEAYKKLLSKVKEEILSYGK